MGFRFHAHPHLLSTDLQGQGKACILMWETLLCVALSLYLNPLRQVHCLSYFPNGDTAPQKNEMLGPEAMTGRRLNEM